ncbi:hypothetical protein [Jeotgalibacillus campisalis]|uniref:Uncharacterized protein n=1 Tax=Jeotgalibacillus campisalis TaxID=220754 RepID=A0A0C2VTY7_9BACL|nr:hypothetical protein [Jeotgalibacillus campisalis]KIL47448.1 hypothetical protein KR50_16150 [Jeotgalibacillus campisalis]
MTTQVHNYVYGIEAAASILGLPENLVQDQMNNHEIFSNRVDSQVAFNRSELFNKRYQSINEQIRNLTIKYKSIPVFDDKLTLANGIQRTDIAEILAELERSVLTRELQGNQEVRIRHKNKDINITCNIRYYNDNLKVIFFR